MDLHRDRDAQLHLPRLQTRLNAKGTMSAQFVVLAGAALLSLWSSDAATAQEVVQIPQPSGYERGCRGDEITAHLSRLTGRPTSYPVVTAVESGSPSEAAGLQVGDSLVAHGGVDVTKHRPPPQRYAVNDTVHLVVRRAGQDRKLAVVMGRRDLPNDAAGRGVCRHMRPQ